MSEELFSTQEDWIKFLRNLEALIADLIAMEKVKQLMPTDCQTLLELWFEAKQEEAAAALEVIIAKLRDENSTVESDNPTNLQLAELSEAKNKKKSEKILELMRTLGCTVALRETVSEE